MSTTGTTLATIYQVLISVFTFSVVHDSCFTDKQFWTNIIYIISVVVVLTLTRIIKAYGHRTSSSYSGAEKYPREKTQTNQRRYTHISQLTQCMPPPGTYSGIGGQPTMYQVHTGAYVSLLAPGKPTPPLATQERLPCVYYA